MIGQRIGNFTIVQKLGEGGMGEVYRAVNDTVETPVAVKMLLPQVSAHKQNVQRFFNEAVAVSKIQHSGIGKIFDVGFHESGRAYLVMEFLEGETLAAKIKRLGRLTLSEISDVGQQIASVLGAVHEAGVTHRDLKPDNIFLVRDRELISGQRVKILDFGIAKISGPTSGLTATTAALMGTPWYMSPEQWRNSGKVDWRADAYSLGCVAFEMTTGRVPFDAETFGEICSKHLEERAPKPSTLVPVPKVLDDLIGRLLAKAPAERPDSMRLVADAFAALGDRPAKPAKKSPLSSSDPVVKAPYRAHDATTIGGGASIHARARRRATKHWKWSFVVLVAGGGVAASLLAARRTNQETPGDASIASLTTTAGAPPSPTVSPLPDPTIAKADSPPAAARTSEASKPPAAPKPDASKGGRLRCDGDSLQARAEESLKAGRDVEALQLYEAAMKCKPDEILRRAAYFAACRSKNWAKAHYYFPQVPVGQRDGIDQICLRYGFDPSLQPSTSNPRTPESIGQEATGVATDDGGGSDGAGVPSGLDRSMIQAGVDKVKARVSACGDRSTARGQVKVSVRVGPAGNVTSVLVKSTPDASLANCVVAEMRKATFAMTDIGGSFAYPFNF